MSKRSLQNSTAMIGALNYVALDLVLQTPARIVIKETVIFQFRLRYRRMLILGYYAEDIVNSRRYPLCASVSEAATAVIFPWLLGN